MKTYDLHLFLNLRRALYAFTFATFILAVILFFLAVRQKENPIGAEISLKDRLPRKLTPENVDRRQILFTLTNRSAFDWNDVRLTVNDVYLVEPGPMVVGESKDVRIGDMKYFDTVPTVLIPANRSESARKEHDPESSVTKQNIYGDLSDLNMIKIRTSAGRVMYDPAKDSYTRMGSDGQPTTFFSDLKKVF